MSNRSSSSLELKELNELVNCQEDVLQGLFDGHLTTATAAPQLAAVTIPDSNIDSEACEERLQMLWNNVLYFLIREPNRIDTIATLIHCISNLPLPLTEDGKQLAVNEGLRRVWEDKPTLGWELRDEWNVDLSARTDTSARQSTTDRFIAMNALIATRMAYDGERFDYRNFTLWTFRGALEYTAEMPEEDIYAENGCRECHVLAVAKLVEIAGHVICQWDYNFATEPLVGHPGQGGAL